MPIVEMFEKEGKLKKVDALQTDEEVFAEVKQALSCYILWQLRDHFFSLYFFLTQD